MGGKFVPNLNFSYFHIYKNLLKFIDTELPSLNMKLFFLRYKNYSNSSASNIVDDCKLPDYLDLFFEKSKIVKDPSKFPLLRETIDFRFTLFKYFSDMFSYIKSNISFSDLNSLIKFKKDNPFKIIDTDKNVGLAIISNDLYFSLSSKYLDNNDTY